MLSVSSASSTNTSNLKCCLESVHPDIEKQVLIKSKRKDSSINKNLKLKGEVPIPLLVHSFYAGDECST